MPRKPMLSVDDLIIHAQDKGIRFEKMSISDAKSYLGKNNNYFKLSSYRKNYDKHLTGKPKDKYIDLDFAYLIELARIDVAVRHILLSMCLDIEHFLKVALITEVEKNMIRGTGEDGYKIISDYMIDANESNFEERSKTISRRTSAISKKLHQNISNPYCGGLLEKYSDDMPIWAFVELISFGDLKDLIGYYSETTQWTPPVDLRSLDRVRQIRNAAAHNNCIINDLKASKEKIQTPSFITRFVSNCGISANMRDKKLSNKRINQIVHLFYVYDKVVTSDNTRKIRLDELNNLLSSRMLEHQDYFQNNKTLVSVHHFFTKIVSYMLANS